MNSLVRSLCERKLLEPPPFLSRCMQFEVSMGSRAFGTSGAGSDWDVYGFCIPPAEVTEFQDFTALDQSISIAGEVRQYDFKIWSLDQFWTRLLIGKSQTVETLFTAESNVLFMTPAAKLLRDNRQLLLHQGTAREFRRFAKQQLDDLVEQRRQDGKRKEYIALWGYDVKAAYPVVRLMTEAQQLLAQGTLQLGRDRATLMSIRSGHWKLGQVVAAFHQLDEQLSELATSTRLPAQANADAVASLLQHVRAAATLSNHTPA